MRDTRKVCHSMSFIVIMQHNYMQAIKISTKRIRPHRSITHSNRRSRKYLNGATQIAHTALCNLISFLYKEYLSYPAVKYDGRALHKRVL